MRVLTISSLYPRPDKAISATCVHFQAVELLNLGAEVRVICPLPAPAHHVDRLISRKPGRSSQTLQKDTITVTYLPYAHIPLRLSVRLEIASLYRTLLQSVEEIRSSFRFDFIHAHRLFPTGYAALQVARKVGVPCVVTAHGSDVHTNPSKNGGIARYTRATIMGGDRIVAVSRDLARRIVNLGPPTVPVQVVYNSADTDQFKPIPDQPGLRQQLGLPREGVGLCTVCRLVKEKGVQELVQAFAEIARAHPQVWLTIVGDGPLRDELRASVEKRGLKDRVFLVGSRPHDQIPLWMNAADVFVLASYNEGLPVVVLEAMACARPVVATAVGGVAEVAADGISALLVPSAQVAPLVEALDRLVRSPGLCHQLGQAGYQRLREKFLWSHSASELMNVYQSLSLPVHS